MLIMHRYQKLKLLSSAEALGWEKLREKRGKEREKLREEKEASARCHTQDSHYPGVDFFNFQPARLRSLQSKCSHYLFLTSVVTDTDKLLQNAEWCLGDYQEHHREKVYCS